MKINKNSALYKFTDSKVNYLDWCNNLCEFVRKVMWAVLKTFAIDFAFLFVILSLVIQLVWVVAFDALYDGNYFAVLSGLIFVVTIAALIAAVILFVCVGVVLSVKFLAKWINSKFKITKPSDEPREPSIILEYLKAKKQKICPFVEFVEK